MTTNTAAAISPEEFLADFHHTTLYGKTEANGIDRQAATAEHGQVRDWFQARAEELGFDVSTDPIGNIFATKTWTPGKPYVLVGSHLDSQPLGGRFDGTYGVIAGLHAAAALNSQVNEGVVEPQFNIAVVDWFNEEGSRFTPSLMGSSVFAGLQDLETTLNSTDPEGITVREALKSTGRLGEPIDFEIAGNVEVHIEQGRRLERAGVPIGVVERSWFTQKLLVTVIGEQSHTGATLLADRRDALIAASKAVIAVEETVYEMDPETVVTSVGTFNVEPNSPIVVPRQVDMVVDIRADQDDDVAKARAIILEKFAAIAQERNVEIRADDYDVRPVSRFPEESVELAHKAARDEGHESMTLSTLAGHDAVAMNRVTPAVLIFVPSENGISHSEREFTRDEDLVEGVKVIAGIITRLVQGELKNVSPGGAQ